MDLYPRHIRERVVEALDDTRVVVVLGARQVGKSTLVEGIARERGMRGVVTLDDQAARQSATADPVGFIAGLSTPVAIDEIQRVPDLMLAIKRRVDLDHTAGQFLLTGSANILTAPRIADALTGRAEYHRLAPLTQREIHRNESTVLSNLFAGDVPRLTEQPIGRTAYAPIIAQGGYPEGRVRTGSRRSRFFDSYVRTVIERDLRAIASVRDHQSVLRLLRALAATSGSLLNASSIARDLAVDTKTVQSHADLLETLFLTRRLPPYSGNLLTRVVRTPKSYIADSGLLAYLVGADEERITEDARIGGSIFETFVVMELLRQMEACGDPISPFHYRDKDQREVDLVLERYNGDLLGIEVKAAASVQRRDFAGLRHLRDKLGKRFRTGVIVYTGESTVPFGDRLWALPATGLWSAAT